MHSAFKYGLFFSAALTLAPLSHAQGDAESRQDTITVTASPIRDSQAAAINAKRNADNVVEVIAADTIGRFPDQTLAQALTRIPGLAVEGDQGEARFVNFRGGRFRYTTISFDGVDVLGADNGRIPRFDSIPAVITSAVEASKAVTPDTPGAPVLGHININTYSPFDTDGFGLSASAAVGETSLNDAYRKRYALRTSYSGDQFGILAFGTLDKRDRIVDNREYGLVPGGVESLDFRQYRGFRENYSYGGKAEFRPKDGPVDRLFATSIFYEFVDDEERNQHVFDFLDFAGDPATLAYGTSGTALALPTRLLEHGRYETSTFTNTIGADLELGEWLVTPRLNYTETKNFTSIPLVQSLGFSPFLASYDLANINDPIVTVSDLATGGPADIDNSYNLDLFINVFYKTDTTSTKGLVDFERDLTLFERDTVLKTGFAYDMREAEGGNATIVQVGGLPINPSSYATSTPWNSDFTNSIGAVYYDNVAMGNDLIAGYMAADPNFEIYPDFDPVEQFGIEENLFAAYAMATSEFDWGNLVYGLRVEHTDFSTDGNQVIAGVSTPINASNDYTNLLPSVHANFDLSDSLKLRLSATTGISRPSYPEARASQSVDAINLMVSGGNPDLDAEESIGLDASIEWYFDTASILSASAFYRSIDNVIYPGATMVDGSNFAPGLFAPGEMVAYNSFFNGEDGKLSGIEFNYIGTFDDFLPVEGFGATGNVSFLDSEFYAPSIGITAPIPGTSDLIYNASVFYENHGISARVSYQRRDTWLSTTESGPELNQYWDETERLDAKIQYQLPFDLSGATTVIFAEANNLTDYNDRRYIGTSATIDQIEGYGKSFMFGFSVDY
ncbi:MAG: hypothetical protein CMK09_18225 [Ponticaulis sp.]|nr:hypothetical protein [Ponticaulis sp.]|tara:strand:+ start:4171 stop:6705 length:2535 start_codon:yes stop_codon:yes gene_type:complete